MPYLLQKSLGKPGLVIAPLYYVLCYQLETVCTTKSYTGKTIKILWYITYRWGIDAERD